jgi:hypothetical protein
MAHFDERFPEKHGNQGVVFYHEYLKRFHQ